MDKILANETLGVPFVFFDEADTPVREYTETIDRYLPVSLASDGGNNLPGDLPDDFIGPPNAPGKTTS